MRCASSLWLWGYRQPSALQTLCRGAGADLFSGMGADRDRSSAPMCPSCVRSGAGADRPPSIWPSVPRKSSTVLLCPTWALTSDCAFVHRGPFDPDPQLVTIRQVSDDGVQVSVLVRAEQSDRLLLERLEFPYWSADWHLAQSGQSHVQLHRTSGAGVRWYLTGDGEVIPD